MYFKNNCQPRKYTQDSGWSKLGIRQSTYSTPLHLQTYLKENKPHMMLLRLVFVEQNACVFNLFLFSYIQFSTLNGYYSHARGKDNSFRQAEEINKKLEYGDITPHCFLVNAQICTGLWPWQDWVVILQSMSENFPVKSKFRRKSKFSPKTSWLHKTVCEPPSSENGRHLFLFIQRNIPKACFKETIFIW